MWVKNVNTLFLGFHGITEKRLDIPYLFWYPWIIFT